MDTSNLKIQFSPTVDQSTLLSANVDLFTDTSGYNQDIGIFVSDNGGSETLLAWKESGGSAGTYSPNAAYVQYLYNMTGGHTYVFKVKWKTSIAAPGVTIYAGAGSGTTFPSRSPTSLVAETFPPGVRPNFVVSTKQYALPNSDGTTWHLIDSNNLLSTTLNPASNSTAVLGANADLWTATSGGYNQDLGIFVSVDGGTDALVAWKESGGSGGTYSPNAAFAKATYAMTGGLSYAFKLKWKTNKNATGGTIFAGAGPLNPANPAFSPTSLLAETLAASANPYTAVTANSSSLTSSDGATWQNIDAALNVTVPGLDNTNVLLGGNADLFTDTAGYNQDIGLFVSDNGGADALVAWKESGGFGGIYSPNAAYVQSTWPLASGHTYVFRLKWKTNKNAPSDTIYAGAGSGSTFPGRSPTTLVAEAPPTVPGPPTNVTAVAGTAQATVSWTPPASDGGLAISSYVVTPHVGTTAGTAVTTNGSTTTATVSGLTYGTSYTFQVYATNGAGTGPSSAASNAVYIARGAVHAWGYAGQLGNGSNTDSPVPVPVRLASSTAITAIAASGQHTLALTSSGGVVAWGSNGAGELGNGTRAPSNVPVAVSLPSNTTVTAVAAGFGHSLALTSTGSVLAWGFNSSGELGNGTTTDTWVPTTVSIPTGTIIIAVAAGQFHSLALTSTGSVLAWGSNSNGELGNGTTTNSTVPAIVSLPGGTIVSGVAGGYQDSLAVTSTGSILAWGYNYYGQLGNGSTIDSSVPVAVSVPSNTVITAVAAGGYHSLGVTSTGSLLAWGDNTYGQLGNGTTTWSTTPLAVRLPTDAIITSVAAGPTHNLAVTSAGSVLAWGLNLYGKLGNGTTTDSSLPVVSLPRGTRTVAVSADNWDSYAIVSEPAGGPLSYSELIGGWNPCMGCFLQTLFRHQVGRPVDSYNGGFSHAFGDLSVPGHGPPLALSRSYYAYPDDPTNLVTHLSVPNGSLGYGWTFNYNVSVAVTGSSPNQIATVTQETGATTVFDQPASGNGWAAAVPRTIATLVKNGNGTWTLTRHATDILNFDASGRLTSLRDLNGYLTGLSYNASNQLTDVTDPEGRVLHFVWNGTGSGAEISSATILFNTPAARTETFSYDGNGNLHTATDVGNGQWTFGYDANHHMTTMQNPRMNTVTNHYDANNRVDWQEDELSRRTCFDYTSIPGATKVTDPSGANTCAGSVRVDYYAFGILSGVTKGYGTPDAATWSFGHDPNTLRLTATVDPLNHTSYASYDASGNLLTATDPLGRTTTNTYNPQNQISTSTDPSPSNVTTTYGYDATGINLTSVSRPLTSTGQTATTSYAYAQTGGCGPGDTTSMTDANTKTWSYTCNNHGYPITTRDPLGNVAGAVYDENGWLTASFTPKAGCAITQTPPTGCSATYQTQYDHDPFGRVKTITDPLSHTTVRHYDANGNLDRFTDGAANITYTGYSSADEACWSGVFSTAPSWSGIKCTNPPPSGFHRQTTYNADGTVAAEIDGRGKNTIAYSYDGQKRVKTFADALHAVQTYAYNGDGTVATLTDNQATARVTTYSYDAGAQLTGVSYSDGSTPNITSIGYDALGRRASLVDNISGGQTSTWVYDSLGRLSTYTPGSSPASTVTYGYDLKGQQTSVTYPGQPTAVTRIFDDAGRMKTVKDWAGNTTTFGYDANSNLTTETFPNATDTSAMVDTFAFDAADRLLNPTANQPTITYAKAGSSYGSFSYSRDNADRLASESATGMPGVQLGSVNYTPLSQVQNVQAAPAYSYDAADNPTSLAGGTSQTYDDANQLCWRYTSASACGGAPPATGSATQFTYDTRGNRTAAVPYSGGSAQSATCYGYDQQSRMTQLSTGTGSACATPTTTAAYTYDGSGLRISKTVGATTTSFLWDPSGKLPMVLREVAGSTTDYYIYGPGGTPLEQISGSTFLYYHHDQLGSTRAITDAAGAPKATYTYDAYGTVSACTGTTVKVSGSNICTGTIQVSNPLAYTGQYSDAESGLIYLRARYYDPGTAQFISRDPAVAMTHHPYSYAYDSPLNLTDPSGLCAGGYDGLVCIPTSFGDAWNAFTSNVTNPNALIPAVGIGVAAGVGCLLTACTADLAAALVVAGGSGGATLAGAGGTAAVADAPQAPQQAHALTGLEQMLCEHGQKYLNYINNPLDYDNQGTLANAINNNTGHADDIYFGRIGELAHQVEDFIRQVAGS